MATEFRELVRGHWDAGGRAGFHLGSFHALDHTIINLSSTCFQMILQSLLQRAHRQRSFPHSVIVQESKPFKPLGQNVR